MDVKLYNSVRDKSTSMKGFMRDLCTTLAAEDI